MGHESNEPGEIEMNEKKNKKKTGSWRSIFMHADGVDEFLMALGLIGAAADGFLSPAVKYISSYLFNDIGTSSTSDINMFLESIHKVSLLA